MLQDILALGSGTPHTVGLTPHWGKRMLWRGLQCVGPRAQAQATTPHAEPARLTSEGAA